jgi:type VI secretion system protein VasJ
MLGSIIPSRKWNWIAVGKHPVAKDYIHFGGQSALLDAVAQWLADGYGNLNDGKNKPSEHHSWRFWLKGVKKGSLVCGLGRDSSDSIGRPYPLLIMGEGSLKGWEKQWPMLPTRLEKTWRRMEYIAAHHFKNAMVMQNEIKRLAVPGSGAFCDVDMSEGAAGAAAVTDLTPCKSQLRQDGFAMIGLSPVNGLELHQVLICFHNRLRQCCTEVPKAVFIGGTPQKTYLAVARHPLGPKDFVKLWTT